jgi:hypothetical protein
VGEHSRKGRFPDTAFTGQDEDLVFYGGEARGYEGDVGIGAFGCGSTYLLIGTTGAGVCLAGCKGFGAGAVLFILNVSIETSRSRDSGVAGQMYLAQAQRASALPGGALRN